MLLFYVKPNKNESLTGLFYRTARENLMDNLGWIKDNFLAFSEYKLNENSINWGDPKVVEDISMFLKIDLELAKKMTFSYFLDVHDLKVDNNKNKIKCPWFLYQTTKVCQECQNEDPYHRMDWSFSYSTICSIHKVYLIDKCQNCNRDFTIKAVVNDKCICGLAVSASKSKIVSNPLVLEYQKEIDKFFFQDRTVNINSWVTNSSVFYNTLEFLATWLPQTINNEDILTIEDIKYNGNVIARTRLKKTKTLTQAIPLYLHSFKILKEWPGQFYDYIDLINESEDCNKFRIFIDVLNKLIGTDLEPLYSEFMNYLLIEQLLDNNLDQFISLKQACLLTQLKEDTIRKSDFIKVSKCTFKNIEFFFTSKNDIQDWQAKYKETISKEELRKIWGTSPKATFNILANNVLNLATNIRIGSVQKWEIPKGTLEAFNFKLQEKSSEISGTKFLLNKAFQWVGVHNSYVIIKAMLAGLIPFELDKKKFGNTLVSKDILFKIMRKVILYNAKRKGIISVRDSTFLLGVKKTDIEYWILTKRLEKSCDNALTFSSFNKFESNFFTTFQLSNLKKVGIKTILTKTQNKIIEPVAGPILNDGQRLLFKKSVIKHL